MGETKKILVVDDEETICEVLKLNLELSGYSVDVAYSAESVLEMDIHSYSLLLLDVMMGKMSGFELASRIRNNTSTENIPIIICTAKDDESDIIEGLSVGADDYIKKPFSMRELILRVNSVLRRSTQNKIDNTSSIVVFDNLRLDIDRKQCFIEKDEVFLTKKEFEILRLFLTNIDKIFSREDILDKVWEDDVLVIDRTIDVNINRLRKKIGEYGSNIVTKLGYGYGFSK
ncbi:MAG: response regulator transcription factor [Muribaculaceae bacterium]|nr:response regulator transcription factor [Muribaculaceae bacterium]